MNDDAQDRYLADLAFGGIADASVAASPLLGPLEGLPPLFLTCATNEVLLDDALLLARAAALAGVPVELRVEAGLFHLWILWPHILPEAVASLGRIAGFIGSGSGT